MNLAHRTIAAVATAALAGGLAVLTATPAVAAPATTAAVVTLEPADGTPDSPDAGRPGNGAVLRSTDDHGDGYVVVDGGAEDGVLTLAQDGRAVRSVYVRAGEKPKMVDVPDGTYDVFVVSGSGYDRAAHRFAQVTSAERYAEPIDFTTDDDGYTWWELSIDDVPDGTADTADVAPADVPA